MKIYYLLDYFNLSDKKIFDNIIDSLFKIEDIDDVINNKYYRVDYINNNGRTSNSFLVQTLMFIKYIWEKYNISPDKIEFIYKEQLVILNEDIYLFKNNKKWIKISNNVNSYLFSSLHPFSSPFWYLWKKIEKINKKFPKLVFPNDNREYCRDDKLRYIMNIYEKREKLIGDFMLPLFNVKSNNIVKNTLKLWRSKTGKKDVVMKYAWATDNGKHIKLLNINKYLKDPELCSYLLLKYFNSINEYTSLYYFVDYYESYKEFRLYLSKNNIENNYKLYSVKIKHNLTEKIELFDKENFRTGTNLRVSWECIDNSLVDKKVLDYASYVFEKNKFDTGVIEFITTNDGNIRFLEINNLGGTLMFSGDDENNIKNRLYDMWDNLFIKNKIGK